MKLKPVKRGARMKTENDNTAKLFNLVMFIPHNSTRATSPLIDSITRKMVSIFALSSDFKAGDKLIECPVCNNYTSNKMYRNGKLVFNAMCVHNVAMHRDECSSKDLKMIDDSSDIECRGVPEHMIHLSPITIKKKRKSVALFGSK